LHNDQEIISNNSNNESIEQFEIAWIPLPKATKRVFKYLQNLSKKHKFVFPSLATIAAYADCSIRTVFRSLAIFMKQGWLAKERRGYQSSVYFLTDFLIKLDIGSLFSKRDSREKCHESGSVLELQGSYAIDLSTPRVPISQEIRQRRLTAHEVLHYAPIYARDSFVKLMHWCRKGLIKELDCARMALTFSEYEVESSIMDTKFFKDKGNVPDKNWISVLWGNALRYKRKKDNYAK